MNKNYETFVIHIATLEMPILMSIYLSMISQVKRSDKLILVMMQWDKVHIKILAEYSYYPNIFLTNLAIKLPKNTGKNEYIIKLIKKKQLSYRPI